MSDAALSFTVNKSELGTTEVVPIDTALRPGQALLRVDRFALTANNITYAIASSQLGYWDFFPDPRDGWGRIPVWGFAEVEDPGDTGLAQGMRVYGYLPMATHLVVQPTRINDAGFMDGAPHRAGKAPIYNHYSAVDQDPLYRLDQEAMIALFRPLFTTSFLLDDMIRSQGDLEAEQVVLTSASSKTAIGLALCLFEAEDRPRIVGLTSDRNRAFVEELGVYDSVLSYDAIDALGRVPSVTVDMAGNRDVIAGLHHHLQDNLRHSARVGGTHWQDGLQLDRALPGAKPTFFFAPTYAQHRLKDWGQDGFNARLGAKWSSLIEVVAPKITVREVLGQPGVEAGYLDLLGGSLSPRDGLIASLHNP